jgi:hypothetical protein
MNTRGPAVAGIVGGAATALSGVVIEAVVKPATEVPAEQWSYPWSSDVLGPVSVLYAGFHFLVFLGMVALARALRGGSRAGTALAMAGTFVFFLAEFGSIPFADQTMDDTGPMVVGAAFGLGVALTAIGLILTGAAVLRAGEWTGWQRYAPLGAGLWATVMIGLSFTSALPVGVAVYGLTLVALNVAVLTVDSEPVRHAVRTRARAER